ncbi:hypothetical protein LZ554_008880 [Drepanopeziza brunnea f. sp. 'monogermtubi']|nr:hypothetical protein LZ554_008880 [Drepanopeziza brunnea f. sp. 'monogermtubi']
MSALKPTIVRSLLPPSIATPSAENREPTPRGPLTLPAPSKLPAFRNPARDPYSQTSTPFNDLINALSESLTTTRPPHLPTLTDHLRAYTSHASHWSQYAVQNPDKQYTRNLVAEEPKIFNLLILVWTPGKKSPVHDHASSHCLMKILQGRLRETRYEMPEGKESVEGGLREVQRMDFAAGKVAYISDRLGLHEICNPSETEYAVSLHLYTPPNVAMYGCHVFDTATGKSTYVPPGGYDSVRGVVSK